jgi:hypothetical protein
MWSYALAAVGLTGLWLAGSGKALGWMVGVGAQAIWIAYAVATRQYGFIITAVAYGFVYLRGGLKARAATRRRPPAPIRSEPLRAVADAGR